MHILQSDKCFVYPLIESGPTMVYKVFIKSTHKGVYDELILCACASKCVHSINIGQHTGQVGSTHRKMVKRVQCIMKDAM